MQQQYNILLESCYVVEPSEIKIISESDTTSGAKKTVFKTKLQTIGEVNQNKRMYTRAVGDEIVKQMTPMAKQRSLFQEIDHPAPTADAQASMRRAACVELKNCGSLLRRVYMEGDDIIGEMETLTGFLGPDLHDLITVDKSNIGFSLRMLGRLGKHPTMEGVVVPQTPLRAVTYDVVTNPSHSSARVMSITTENELLSLKQIGNDTEIISESALILEGLNLPSSNNIVDSFINDVMLETFNNYSPKWGF